MELKVLEWTFFRECKVSKDIENILVDGESATVVYKTIRDLAIFTNKRLIVKDKQGITGLKSEIFSLPYKSIIMWSIENAGKIVDFNSEVVLWTRIGKFKIKLGVDIDVKKNRLFTCKLYFVKKIS